MPTNEPPLTYTEAGTGPAVLFVHGHPFDRSMWDPQLAHLSANAFRAVAPDLRGYGESPLTPGTVGFPTHTGDLLALLDHMGIDKAVLCGLSMGGQLAMEFHRTHPDRVRALVLADTSAHPETPESRQVRMDVADRLEAEGMAWYADEVKYKMVSRQNPETADHVHTMMRAAPARGAAAAQRGRADRPDYFPSLWTAKVPALVVVGTEDAFTPVETAQEIADAIPGATLLVVEGAAHMPNLERPDVFNEALLNFLKTLD